MTNYISTATELPNNLGEIYSDRNIRIIGQARINPSNPNQIDTLGLQILCSPIDGGYEAIASVPDATYTLLGAGSSLWIKVSRTSNLLTPITVTPEIYASGSQPKSRRDYVQVFYQTSTGQIVSVSSFLIYTGPLYTRLGYGVGQRIYDAIVGNVGDDHATHTDLQTAINDAPNNGWILVKKMCLVTTMINTNSKCLKLVFEGYGTGLQASGATTGIRFDQPGCQLVGFGQIKNFATYGVDLNNQTNSRLEMVFTGNGANINFGTLTSIQVNYEGSYGLTETSHIETSTLAGVLGRWNDTKKRWEPISAIGGKTTITVSDLGVTTIAVAGGSTVTIDATGKLTSTGTIQGAIVIGAVYQ